MHQEPVVKEAWTLVVKTVHPIIVRQFKVRILLQQKAESGCLCLRKLKLGEKFRVLDLNLIVLGNPTVVTYSY